MKITIDQLSKIYPNGNKALNNIQLEIENGMFGLLGPNGAGKSTLMRILVTLMKPSKGKVTVNGFDLVKNRKEIRKMLGYLPQDFRFFSQLKTYEFLDYAARLAGMKSGKERAAAVDKMLEEVGLFEARDRQANRLSFSSSTIEDFNDAILDEFGIDLIPYMEDWFSSMELPAFLIGAVNAVNVLDGDQLKTMVKFKVSNTEDVEGIISVEFRLGGGGRFLMGRGGGSFGGTSADNIVKLIHLEGNQTKEVSFLLNGTPRGATINTLTSRNIPSEIRFPLDNIEEDKKAVPYEGEQVVDIPVRIAEDNEIIVDNEDMYFTVDGSEEKSLLRKLLISEEKTIGKYSGFSGISYIFLTPVDLFEMTRQLMFPVLFLGSMAFMFSTIIKNGNGTAVVMVILGVLMLILREPVERTMWNIFLNPFNVPRNMNEMIWEGIARNNRIFLVVGALVFILYGLFNLQKREKFI